MIKTRLIVSLLFWCLIISSKAQTPINGQYAPTPAAFEKNRERLETIKVKVSQTFGVSVLVGGRFKGVTPCEIELPPGNHFFVLTSKNENEYFFSSKEILLTNDTVLFFFNEMNTIGKTKRNNSDNFSETLSHSGSFDKNSARKRKQSFVGFGTSVGYQRGWYTGELSRYLTSHNLYKIPVLNLDFWLQNYFFQISLEPGDAKASSININGDFFEGKFRDPGYTASVCFKVGYDIFGGNKLSLVPNIGVSRSSHSLETEFVAKRKHFGSIVKEIKFFYYRFGCFLDYKFYNYGIDRYFTIRIYYDLGLMAKMDGQKRKGTIHHVAIALTASLRE